MISQLVASIQAQQQGQQQAQNQTALLSAFKPSGGKQPGRPESLPGNGAGPDGIRGAGSVVGGPAVAAASALPVAVPSPSFFL